MNYVSTRGETTSVSFTEALLAGLARDGGLYVPETVPVLTPSTIASFAGRPFVEVIETVISPFATDAFDPANLRRMIETAYATFRHPAVTPLVQLDTNLFVLELFHGRTLAFKDVAMQLLGRMMDATLKRSGRRATIVGATSGDTGAAAIDAFRGLDQVDVFILYPHGRVSDVQRRQMTTIDDGNVHTIAIEGTFDDCQAIVKGLFNHHTFRDRVGLSGVNSINWARIVAQIGYYFVAGAVLGSPHRALSYVVPTGNFGDILAGHYAKAMGLPIDRLVIATNENDILDRCLKTGTYGIQGVRPTQSPSMDIQISSNFERLLFGAYGRDSAALRGLMANLAQAGQFTIAPEPLARIRADFDSERVDEAGTQAEMVRTFEETGHILDPHTAIGVAAARTTLARDPKTPVVALGTAHPAKFPDAVARATGKHPALPEHLADLMIQRERINRLPNDIAAVEFFVTDRARILADASA
ncbi:threonine synthase [Lichenihabitans psoromatis]|uniref:threonine synthase n=1 Tax=Lichenihabitans psoromatis TaxID=2528642 RepID=UPI001038591C|nr:threonine synthase [Lichenihabitans psoromatis]